MPAFDVSASYRVDIAAPPERVYATLLAADLGRPWLVRTLMGIRLLPCLVASPRRTWQRMTSTRQSHRISLGDASHSDFVLLEQLAPHEIVLGITGRFWTPAASVVPIPVERFRDALPIGLAQAVWNFAVSAGPGGSALTTETRIRCSDPATLRSFRRYWWIVSSGSGLIRRAILEQIRREATSVTQSTR